MSFRSSFSSMTDRCEPQIHCIPLLINLHVNVKVINQFEVFCIIDRTGVCLQTLQRWNLSSAVWSLLYIVHFVSRVSFFQNNSVWSQNAAGRIIGFCIDFLSPSADTCCHGFCASGIWKGLCGRTQESKRLSLLSVAVKTNSYLPPINKSYSRAEEYHWIYVQNKIDSHIECVSQPCVNCLF